MITLQILGGNSPVLYTIDCKYMLFRIIYSKAYLIGYLASYLIIRQLRHNKRTQSVQEEEEENELATTTSHLQIRPKIDIESSQTCSQCITLNRINHPLLRKEQL